MWPNDDRVVLLCESSETFPELRWRPRSWRIRRYRQVIDQPGLEIFLLLTQQAPAVEGTQLAAECPGRRTRTRQPRASRVDPRMAQRSDGTDHGMCSIAALGNNARPFRIGLGTRVAFPRYFYMPDGFAKSKRDLRKSREKPTSFTARRGAKRKRDKASAIGRVPSDCSTRAPPQ
jgi:hypothetical protein